MNEGIEGIGNGEKSSLIEEINALRPEMTNFLLSIGCPQNDVEDVVQITLARLCRSADSFRGDSSLKTWVLGAAENNWKNYTRPLYRKLEVPAGVGSDGELLSKLLEEMSESQGPEDPPDKAAIRNERIKLLYVLLARLDDLNKEIVTDRYIHNMPLKAIAEKYSLTETAVRHRVADSIKRLSSMIPDGH